MTTVNGPLADARDMFAAHTLFRREFGLMPGLVRAVAAGDTKRSALVADHVAFFLTFAVGVAALSGSVFVPLASL